ncbi:sensor domain-containing diguanylate cyclase [Paraburkholderia sp. J8-2]|uniref:GGDEF domain-containing protein n=1 Tax=Paraburkholderia sp. J8-2 TaxID=2805440 RepID=UPI002AB6407A|nr:PfkB family carbohydrate kinase [Paraburkholderia sp. J8-2]
MKALVVGSAHLDILGRPHVDSAHVDQPGYVALETGGTACNLAFNLRHIEQEVRLLTAWGTGPLEALISGHIRSTGVEVMADESADLPLAAFVAHLTADGDLDRAVSDMPVERHVFAETRIAEALEGVGYVFLEANLSTETILQIARAAAARRVPVFALAVSEAKVLRLQPALSLFRAVFMNGSENNALMESMNVADASEIAQEQHTIVVVTRGGQGAAIYRPDGSRIRVHAPILKDAKTLLGVGDAFSAGFVDGLMRQNLSIDLAAAYANELVVEIANQNACNAFSMHSLDTMARSLLVSARNDKLTGLLRRAPFEDEYERFRSSWRNAVLLIDCDNFKNVNDTMGHSEGDRVLQAIGHAIVRHTRPSDLSCRWGGDEFVVLLPRTKEEDAAAVAERIRASVEAMPLHGVTLSIGVSGATPGQMLEAVIGQADTALYDAKRRGRNKVALTEAHASADAV